MIRGYNVQCDIYILGRSSTCTAISIWFFLGGEWTIRKDDR